MSQKRASKDHRGPRLRRSGVPWGRMHSHQIPVLRTDLPLVATEQATAIRRQPGSCMRRLAETCTLVASSNARFVRISDLCAERSEFTLSAQLRPLTRDYCHLATLENLRCTLPTHLPVSGVPPPLSCAHHACKLDLPSRASSHHEHHACGKRTSPSLRGSCMAHPSALNAPCTVAPCAWGMRQLFSFPAFPLFTLPTIA